MICYTPVYNTGVYIKKQSRSAMCTSLTPIGCFLKQHLVGGKCFGAKQLDSLRCCYQRHFLSCRPGSLLLNLLYLDVCATKADGVICARYGLCSKKSTAFSQDYLTNDIHVTIFQGFRVGGKACGIRTYPEI